MEKNDSGGTLESARELDRYGVWVKSDPQIPPPPEQEASFQEKSQEKTPESDIFDDIENMEPSADTDEDAEEPAPAVAEKPSASKQETAFSWFPISNASVTLLTNILEELSSIKNELAEFKALVRDNLPVQAVPQESPEKIVLAGDELDGIFSGGDVSSMPPVSAELDREEDLQWLRENGDKPLPPEESQSVPEPVQESAAVEEIPPPKAASKAGDFAMDDLFIETGSIRDIPIDLTQEESEESEDLFEEIDFDPESEEYFEDTLEDDLGPSGEEVFGESALDIKDVIFADNVDISDEELDRLERNILLEFSEKLPVIEEIFDQDEQTRASSETDKKKTYRRK
jgi:hypothetical protein